MDGLAIAASLSEIRAAVEGGFVDTIHQPTRDTFILRLRGTRKVRLLLSPRRAAVHLTTLDLANPQHPSPFVMLLRRHLRGGRLVAIRQEGWDRVVTFDVERRDGRRTRTYRLVAELTGLRGNVLLVERGTVVGFARVDRRNRPGHAYVPVAPQAKLDPQQIPVTALEKILAGDGSPRAIVAAIDGIGRETARDLLTDADEGERVATVQGRLRTILAHVATPAAHVVVGEDRAVFYPVPAGRIAYPSFGEALDAVSAPGVEEQRAEETSARVELQRAISRHRRTLAKLADWLDVAEEADRLQATADLLMIHQAEIPAKSSAAVVTDPATEEDVTVRLIPSLTAIENAQRMYERAKRLRRGRPRVTSRIERLEREVRSLEKALADLEAGRTVAESVAIDGPSSRGRGSEREPSRHRIEAEGFIILVGRNARDNDRLLREANPSDLWLHAKGVAGSHVIVKRGGRREIPERVVDRAARLAAVHSKARGERRVEVWVTEVKHVRKPKGAPDGLVNVAQGATLTVAL